MDFGAYTGPLRSRTIAIGSPVSRSAPGRTTTSALTASPHFGSGTPITAATDTAGCEAITSSISRGNTLKPPETIMSFLRSTM